MCLERIKLGILFILISLVTSACSVFAPIKTESINTYVLTNTPTSQIKKSANSFSLLVATPQSSAVYNTTQMAYSTHPFAIAYFAKSQWADAPAQMLQPLMVKTLQNTRHFHEILSPGDLGHYDYVLNSELLTIQQNFYGSSSQMVIVLRTQLVNAATNRVIATKEFKVEEPAAPNPYGGVVAANRGVEKILVQLRSFVLTQI